MMGCDIIACSAALEGGLSNAHGNSRYPSGLKAK